jgi:hypothetical protein
MYHHHHRRRRYCHHHHHPYSSCISINEEHHVVASRSDSHFFPWNWVTCVVFPRGKAKPRGAALIWFLLLSPHNCRHLPEVIPLLVFSPRSLHPPVCFFCLAFAAGVDTHGFAPPPPPSLAPGLAFAGLETPRLLSPHVRSSRSWEDSDCC